MKNNDRHMALPTDLTLPEGIVPVDDLLRADPSDGRPIVLVTAGESETALEIPAGADLTLIEFFEKNADARTEISLGPDARFHHIRIITDGADTTCRITQADGSTLSLSTLVLGGNSQNSFEIDCHQGTHTSLYGLALPQGDETVGNHIRLYHKKPYGQSFQRFKYVADGHSRARFDGKIIVEKDAQKIEAYQKNNNILLADTARIETDPQLEIYADDVRCSHGATVGQLDDTALFYMQSRGIPYRIAHKMLVRSFLDETLDGLAHIDWLHEAIEKIISKRLGQ